MKVGLLGLTLVTLLVLILAAVGAAVGLNAYFQPSGKTYFAKDELRLTVPDAQ